MPIHLLISGSGRNLNDFGFAFPVCHVLLVIWIIWLIFMGDSLLVLIGAWCAYRDRVLVTKGGLIRFMELFVKVILCYVRFERSPKIFISSFF